jgi:hypothetical protein
LYRLNLVCLEILLGQYHLINLEPLWLPVYLEPLEVQLYRLNLVCLETLQFLLTPEHQQNLVHLLVLENQLRQIQLDLEYLVRQRHQ